MTDPERELRLAPCRDDLARLYPWLDQVAAGLEPRVLSRLHVVLEEAVSNAALHGYPPGSDGTIVVRLGCGAGHVVLEVEDDGIPFDPTQVPTRPKPRTLADVEPGGWGLDLIRTFCSFVGYQRFAGRNLLTMHLPV